MAATVNIGPHKDNMDTRYSVRRATQADVSAIRAVAAITWEATYRESINSANRQRIVQNSYNPTTLSNAISKANTANPSAWFVVAEAHTPDELPELIGFAEAVLRPASEGVELTRIYLMPHHQSQGVGTLLLDAILAALRSALARGQIALQPPRLTLVVEAHNVRAKTFYQRRGFHFIRSFNHTIYGQVVDLEEHAQDI